MTGLVAFARAQTLAVVSTLGPDGPQSALVGIAVAPDFTIVFDTVEDTRKFRNLMRNPACSLVAGWAGERTVQIDGAAKRTASTADNPVLQPYFAAFPDGRDRLGWAGIAHFVVTPTWARYSDYSIEPALMETWPT